MDNNLLIANVVAFGCLFAIWSKNSWLNMLIKIALLGLLIANIVALVR